VAKLNLLHRSYVRLVKGRIGWLLIAAGLVLFAVSATIGGIRVGPALTHGLTGPSYQTPMDRTLSLSRGTWVVFERSGAQYGGGGFTVTNETGVTLGPGDVEVTGPDGRPIPTSTPSNNETINRNGTIYLGAVSFTVSRAGRYRVEIPQTDDDVILSRDLGSLLGSVLVLILTAIGGLLMAGGGTLTLIVGANRRRRRSAAFFAPPGWYPSPWMPNEYCWWDGRQWVPPVHQLAYDPSRRG
jgi:hypothetical protein